VTTGRLSRALLIALGRRTALGLLTIWLVATITFVLVIAAPGDPAALLLGDDGDAQARARLAQSFGTDRPAVVQYTDWIGRLARFDLGMSMSYRAPVSAVIAERLPTTIVLMLPALLVSAAAAAILGLATVPGKVSGYGRAAMLIGAIVSAVPVYVLGHLLILLFSVRLGWLPMQGLSDARSTASGTVAVIETIRHLTLPTLTLAVSQLVVLWLFVRARAAEELGAPYLRTARAKGLTTAQTYRRHLWPNVRLGFLHFVAARIGSLLAGAVVIESVFGIAGMGRLVVQASLARDVPLVTGIFLLAATMVVLANIAADAFTIFLDPRLDGGERDAF
jgi:peptide/nickel transport system permease protein